MSTTGKSLYEPTHRLPNPTFDKDFVVIDTGLSTEGDPQYSDLTPLVVIEQRGSQIKWTVCCSNAVCVVTVALVVVLLYFVMFMRGMCVATHHTDCVVDPVFMEITSGETRKVPLNGFFFSAVEVFGVFWFFFC